MYTCHMMVGQMKGFIIIKLLGDIQVSIDIFHIDKLILIGHFIDLYSGSMWHLLFEFEENQLNFNHLSLPIDTVTRLSLVHNTTSWLHHMYPHLIV